MFITCLYVVLHHRTGRVQVCRAGHEPLLHWQKKTGKCRSVYPGGIMIGFDRGQSFDPMLHEERFTLDRGDRLFLYTDGLVEAKNAADEMPGRRSMSNMVSKYGGEPSQTLLDRLVAHVDDFRQNTPLSDDMTMVTIRRL
jgi:sigma-B regulation protein RsbU (phosphoserine phosphatase)